MHAIPSYQRSKISQFLQLNLNLVALPIPASLTSWTSNILDTLSNPTLFSNSRLLRPSFLSSSTVAQRLVSSVHQKETSSPSLSSPFFSCLFFRDTLRAGSAIFPISAFFRITLRDRSRISNGQSSSRTLRDTTYHTLSELIPSCVYGAGVLFTRHHHHHHHRCSRWSCQIQSRLIQLLFFTRPALEHEHRKKDQVRQRRRFRLLTSPHDPCT
ncbi:hypothetical protein F4820DRAFT_42217 [Hypoxylon rubiginosum]|uniref:Uncharacterized protein n=1 Tax=Hypoxylon rubiginosum TaxID=110542 RepID=A0ACB9YRK6_9PEZI|nr:hypothetical protein F4820DRAFT_42217 [Hypoxylon rubiginosum]